jgi:hypothetical protein
LGQRGEPVERGDDLFGPGPAFGDAEPGAAGGAGDPGGHVEQPVAQGFGFGAGEVAVQQEVLGPGEQVDGGQGEFQPGGVDGEDPGRETAEAGVLSGPDAIFKERSSLHR